MKHALVIFGGLAFVLAGVNLNILHKERILATGATVLLELAPVDPRSLIQGDYMVLDYRISRVPDSNFSVDDPLGESPDALVPRTGKLVIRLDENGVAHFVRLHDSEPLSPGEQLLRYRLRGGRHRLGAEAFFFQEGKAEAFEAARYGELRVAENGASVLVGLRDADRRPLGRAE